MSSYTSSLRLELPVTGSSAGVWGDLINNGITTLTDASVAGTSTITMVAADYTLSTANGATDEARKMFIIISGSPGLARNVICPSVSKLYFVKNSSGFAQTFKTAAGTGISVPDGKIMALYCDGVNVVEALDYATAPTFGTPALGTPSSGVMTNVTGTASGLTAGNVTTNANLTGEVTSVGNAATLTNSAVIAKVLTGYASGAGTVAATDTILQAIQKLNGNDATNANLTGPITSVGNATSVASQTGTGTTFVMNTNPTLVTPNIGVATGTSFQGIVGNVTPAAGTFTALTSTGNATLGDATTDAHTVNGTLGITANNAGSAFSITQSGAGAAFNALVDTDSRVQITKTSGGTGMRVLGLNAAGAAYAPLVIDGSSVAIADSGTNRFVVGTAGASTLTANTASSALQITQSGAGAALTVTQTGAGNAFVVEDSASTDSTPFVIDTNGQVGIGTTTPLVKLHTQSDTSLGVLNYAAGGGISLLNRRSSGTLAAPTIVASGDTITAMAFQGYDGSAFRTAAQISGEVDGTPGTNDMPGRLVFSTTADGASSPTERMRIDSSGNVGIGGAAPNYTKTYITGTYPTNGLTAFASVCDGTIPSTASVYGVGINIALSTADSATVTPALRIFQASQGTVTGGSRGTLLSQFGFRADEGLTGATTNYGFYAGNTAAVGAAKTAYGFYSAVNIASGGGTTYGFYANGTADNYFAGSVGIGSSALSASGVNFRVDKQITGSTGPINAYFGGEVQSVATVDAHVIYTAPSVVNAAFTLPALYHYRATQGTFGASATVTGQYGFHVAGNLTGAVNNYGVFVGNIGGASATAGKTNIGVYSGVNAASGGGSAYGFYAAGTATNYLNGLLDISGAAAGQIKFPATQNASADANTLDDYEEGTWTPVYSPQSGAFGAIVYDGVRFGTYTKIGRQVTFTCAIRTDDLPIGTASGIVYVSGLPFTNGAVTTPCDIGYVEAFAGDMPSEAVVTSAATSIAMYYRTTSNGASAPLGVADLDVTASANKNYVLIAGTYFV
jgi:hypothetical protein